MRGLTLVVSIVVVLLVVGCGGVSLPEGGSTAKENSKKILDRIVPEAAQD